MTFGVIYDQEMMAVMKLGQLITIEAIQRLSEGAQAVAFSSLH